MSGRVTVFGCWGWEMGGGWAGLVLERADAGVLGRRGEVWGDLGRHANAAAAAAAAAALGGTSAALGTLNCTVAPPPYRTVLLLYSSTSRGRAANARSCLQAFCLGPAAGSVGGGAGRAGRRGWPGRQGGQWQCNGNGNGNCVLGALGRMLSSSGLAWPAGWRTRLLAGHHVRRLACISTFAPGDMGAPTHPVQASPRSPVIAASIATLRAP
ncbi:hypothetical protein BDZ91DRAFT_767882 [Kalaharituber pfeilii]|nr:hypothetical protein BDZ91DRAFT_767882 [Kalaharituber pfeilii]